MSKDSTQPKDEVKKFWMWMRRYRGFTPKSIEKAYSRFLKHRVFGMGMDYPEYDSDKKLLEEYYSKRVEL